MRIVTIALPAFALAGLAVPALAQTAPTPKQFVAKAGASDKFEITEAKLMTGSSDPQVRMIAQHMIADHTDSTAKVKAAAMSDGLKPMPPVLDAKQRRDIAALKMAKGKKKDRLYMSQQLPAHQDALALMQGYSSAGTAPALKQAATDIAPVVQSHIDMFQSAQNKSMPAM